MFRFSAIKSVPTFHRVESDGAWPADPDIDQVQTAELLCGGARGDLLVETAKVNHLPGLVQEVPVGGRPVQGHLSHVREPAVL